MINFMNRLAGPTPPSGAPVAFKGRPGLPVQANPPETPIVDNLDLAPITKAPQVSSLLRTARNTAIALTVGLGSLVLGGCGHSLTLEELGKPAAVQTVDQDQQQALHFELIPNAEAKVDVIRQTHTETYDCGTKEDHFKTCTRTEDDPLQPIGVYLGNGLYLDAGLNLSVVPDRVFHGPVIPQEFHRMEVKGTLGDWTKSVITQNGNDVGISRALTIFDHHIVRESDNKVKLKLGTFSALQKYNTIEVTRSGDTTTIQGWALPGFKALSRVQITQEGDVTHVHPFGIATFVNTDIRRDGDRITVQPFGGRFSRVTIERQADGTIKIKNPFGLSGETVTRGENGLNRISQGLQIGRYSILDQGEGNYLIRQPGGRLTTTTISVQ